VTRNGAASVHQCLLNRARVEGRPFDELLQYFASEAATTKAGSDMPPAFAILGC
jgi:hypothetical protein